MIDATCPVHPDVKALGTCARCGTFGCSMCLTLSAKGLLCSNCMSRVVNLPWDDRATLGMWRAWWRTSVQMISAPSQTLAGAAPDAPISSSLTFALLSGLAGYGVIMLLYMAGIVVALMVGSSRPGQPEPLREMFGPAAVLGPFMLVMLVVAMVLGLVGQFFVTGAMDQLGLMVVGAKPKPFSVTLRASALSMGPYLLGVIPVCGVYIFPIWALVLRILALAQFHQTTGGRATAAVLLPIVVLCGGITMLYAVGMGLALAAVR